LDQVLHQVVDEGTNALMEATVTQTLAEIPPRPSTSSQGKEETSLSDTSAGGREWIDTVAKLMAEVADGLHYAHGRGVIHRDIKPANLMLSKEGHLCVTDFGLARVLQEPGITVTGSFLGTPAYMSPEQIAAGRIKVDHRTDVYSLGVVLYEMLTLQRPFPGESREEILNGVLTKEPRSPRRINAKIPVDLETICLKALEKEPDRRYATAGELANDLRQYLQHGLIAARRAGLFLRTAKWTRRHPTAATAVVAVLIVVAASVVAWIAGGRGPEAQRLVADARLALREGVYRDGLQLIDRAVALDSNSIDARLVRARLLIVNWRMREAADEARSVLQTDPQNYAAHAILAALALFPDRQYRLVSIDPEPHLEIVEASAPESAEAYYLRALGTKDTRRRIELLDRALDLNPGDQLASLARMGALANLKDFELMLSETNRLITARPKSAQGWQMKADAYRQQRDVENARTAIERAMEIDDGDTWNYIRRSWISWRRSWISWDVGEHDEALSDLTRAIELGPAHAFLYRNRAERLNTMGRFEEASADARKSIELNPDDREGFSQLLRSYLNLEQEDEVRATIDELRDHAGGWVDIEAKAWAHRTVADYYRQLKDYDRAMESAERAIEIDPEDFWGFIVRMRIHKVLGDDAAAEADCAAAARIELDEPEALRHRGYRLSHECHDVDRAFEDFSRLIELAPKWHMSYFRRAGAYYQLRHFEQALADLERAIELAPSHPWPYALRGSVYWQQGRFEEGLADKRRSLELDQKNPLAWSNYGVTLIMLGRVEEALAAHEKALELNPRFATAHARRAAPLAWLGRCDEAAVELRRAQEVPPLHFLTRSNIAYAHLFPFYYRCPDHYDLTEALGHARFAFEARPAGRNDWIQALALFREGDYLEAKRLYLELFEKTPDMDAWFTLAICLWHLGEKAEAREFYDRSVTWMEKHQPDNPELIWLRQEAAELLGIQQ
jgi:tetratricopeptide (TPR) repeat protein